MSLYAQWRKFVIIAVLITGVLCLNYLTPFTSGYRHALYRALLYIPLLLGAFWFGIKGAVYVAVSVILLFVPYALRHWDGFSLEDFHQILEAVLYIAFALTAGILVERERKKHMALLQAESLAAVGRAVSDVAHDMKAPLMAIGGFANQVCRALDQEDPKQKKLLVVVQETARLESMVREMLDFGRPMEIQRAETDLNDLVGEIIQSSCPVAERLQVELKAELEPSLPPLSMDTQKFKQVLLNLTVNALEASPPGEFVIIKTTKEIGWASLHVIDRGSGIDTEDEDKVFQPFYTKKKGGTGLGLPIVKKIVDAHEGEISFHRNAKGGITFTVKLPLRWPMNQTR
jgi:two-component system sensor histidine kinase HydH